LKIRKSYACSVKTLHHEKLYGDQESCRLDLKPNPDDIWKWYRKGLVWCMFRSVLDRVPMLVQASLLILWESRPKPFIGYIVWVLQMAPPTPKWIVWRVLKAPCGMVQRSLCCSCVAFWWFWGLVSLPCLNCLVRLVNEVDVTLRSSNIFRCSLGTVTLTTSWQCCWDDPSLHQLPPASQKNPLPKGCIEAFVINGLGGATGGQPLCSCFCTLLFQYTQEYTYVSTHYRCKSSCSTSLSSVKLITVAVTHSK